MTKIIQTLWATFLFTLPFSIRFLVYEKNSYQFGQFNPWVAGFLYLPEILLILIWGLYFYQKGRSEKGKVKGKSLATYLLLLVTLFILNGYLITLFKADSMLAAFWLLRIFEVGMIIQLVKAEIIPIKKTVHWLLYGAIFQIFISLIQRGLNGSVGLHWLGEPFINSEMKGVAKINLESGFQQIRSYGTFLHPNVFAAYLISLFFIGWNYLNKKQRWIYYLLFSIGLIITDSHAAFLSGAVGLFVLAFSNKTQQKISVALVAGMTLINIAFFLNPYLIQGRDDLSITERQQQMEISKNMIASEPFGVGVRNFTLEMENYSFIDSDSIVRSMESNKETSDKQPDKLSTNYRKLPPWQFQPVHNVYYLALNEIGTQGLLLLMGLIGIFIYYYGLSAPVLILLMLANFDHLLWTSWVGMMLIGISIGSCIKQRA